MAPRPSPMYLFIATVSWPLLKGLFRLRARGTEHLPAGGFVLAANHNSNFDPWPLGITLFPKRYLRFMGKSELFWTPFKQFATAAGAFPVRRGEHDTAAIETAAQLCREGHIVVMFPEGTRRKKGLRKKYEPRAHTGAARGSRSMRTCRSSRLASSAPTGSAGSRSFASPTARRSRSTISPAGRMRRRLQPSV